MPGKIKVKVLAGRNLPVMDRAADTTDAFVEIKFGGVTHKTDVCRKSLNPHWNSTEWYRFEVDDSELQDEPLQLRLMDHDTYSANDAIGKVVVSLSPLLAREPLQTSQRPAHTGAIMSGWIPVFDTMHGIRGELNIIVKVELFSDFNKFRQSSCGVHFFHCPTVPPGYRASAIHGFVEELIVNDDPEYQWIDKIRTPRASNEARQVAFIKLSNQVQRRVGLKAAELGANAVVGYQHAFDLEGESGVVARAIGTAVSIVALPTPCQPITVPGYTQQQLKQYMDILATDNENITDVNEYFQTHPDQLHKLLNILHPKLSSNFLDDQDCEDEDASQLTRHASLKSYAESVSIYQDDLASQQSLQNIAEDHRNLQKLLNPDEDGIEEPTGPFKRMKMFRQSSQGFISKRFASMRYRKPDKPGEDQVSLKSNSSDTSRISMTDLRSEFRKLKKLKKPKFRRSASSQEGEGIGMASVLARSILHAHTSLACIAETQDSGDSPCSTLRRTSESEPAINVSDDEHANKITKQSPDSKDTNLKSTNEKNEMKLPEIQFSSLNTLEEEKSPEDSVCIRKISESCPNTPVSVQKMLLKLPGEEGYFGSLSSAMSGESSEIESSSEDDESSDQRTDTERSLETISSVVKSVLENKTDPALIAQMEKKLDNLSKESASIASSDRNEMETTDSSRSDSEHKNSDAIESEKKDIQDEKPPNVNTAPLSVPATPRASRSHFKFHNPFSHKTVSKSISLPASPVEKKEGFMSTHIKRQISKISKNKMIKSLSHLSLRPKKKAEKESVTQTNSASNSDVKSLSPSRETVLGSPFLSYADLVSASNQIADSMESPTSGHTSYFDHKPVGMYIGSEPVSRTSLSGPSSPSKLSMTKTEDVHFFNDHKYHKKGYHTEPTSPTLIKSTGLLHTAMETILMDKIQALMIPATPSTDTDTQDKIFFEDVNDRLEKFDESNRETNSDPKVDCARRLIRQDSIHSSANDLSASESRKMSTQSAKEGSFSTLTSARSVPVLQNLHPIMSGGHGPKLSFLETIPSLPESSFDRSLDDPTPTNTRVSAEALDPSIVCNNSHAACPAPCDREKGSPRTAHARAESYSGKEQHTPTPVAAVNGSHTPANASLNATSAPVGMQHRRSSDSDLSITPKGGSLTMSATGNTSATSGGAILRPSMNSNNLEMLEYPFLTMTEYPPNFIVHIGGMVCARSVKLMDGAESGSRAAWWAELRTELRAHARALRCTAVLGYNETATICEDVCILSASGTAAVIDLETDFTGDPELNTSIGAAQAGSGGEAEPPPALQEADVPLNCSLAHVPYSATGMPYRAELASCGVCRRARVPGVLLSTLERPRALPAAGRSCLVTAAAARARRAPSAEPAARDLSDQLPFLEYELHRLLLAKLYMQGANALFGLRTQIAVGERAVVALATGTGTLVTALPAPRAPALKAADGADARETAELQRALHDALAANRARNGFESTSPEPREPEELAEEPPALELCADKDACVLELDEAEDVETARALAVQRPRHLVAATTSRVCGVTAAPAARPHAFAQVWRARLAIGVGGGGGGGAAERHVARALDGVHYKLRRLAPAALADLRFQLDLPEDEMQLLVSGVALPLMDPSKRDSYTNGMSRSATGSATSGAASGATGGAIGGAAGGADDGADTIFSLDEEQVTPPRQSSTEKQSGDEKSASLPIDQGPVCAWSGIVVTPQCRLSGARCQRWLCALQLLFVRETSSVRELGGLSGLLHTFITEVLAVVRAYTAALGGNALASFYITELMLQENPHKNQGQCLLSVGGDVVHVTY